MIFLNVFNIDVNSRLLLGYSRWLTSISIIALEGKDVFFKCVQG